MTDADRDTQPPASAPSVDDILRAQTDRFLTGVGQIVDPVVATLRGITDELLHLRHEMRTRFDSVERRVSVAELQLSELKRWREDFEARCKAVCPPGDSDVGDG